MYRYKYKLYIKMHFLLCQFTKRVIINSLNLWD